MKFSAIYISSGREELGFWTFLCESTLFWEEIQKCGGPSKLNCTVNMPKQASGQPVPPVAKEEVQKWFWVQWQTLSLGSENLYAMSCLLASCLLEGGWEVLPLVAVSFCLEGGWCFDPARGVRPCEGSWNQIPQFTWVANRAQLSLLAG